MTTGNVFKELSVSQLEILHDSLSATLVAALLTPEGPAEELQGLLTDIKAELELQKELDDLGDLDLGDFDLDLDESDCDTCKV